MTAQRFGAIVSGGGQAGLVTGYFLTQQQRDFVILDAGEQIGGAGQRRWDTLRLFTPWDSPPPGGRTSPGATPAMSHSASSITDWRCG